MVYKTLLLLCHIIQPSALILVRMQERSCYTIVFPDLTFRNYESGHYENVATAIHIK